MLVDEGVVVGVAVDGGVEVPVSVGVGVGEGDGVAVGTPRLRCNLISAYVPRVLRKYKRMVTIPPGTVEPEFPVNKSQENNFSGCFTGMPLWATGCHFPTGFLL